MSRILRKVAVLAVLGLAFPALAQTEGTSPPSGGEMAPSTSKSAKAPAKKKKMKMKKTKKKTAAKSGTGMGTGTTGSEPSGTSGQGQ